MAVGGDATDVVVVEMGVAEVVGRGVALVGAVEEVVVNCALGDEVLGPTFGKMLVVSGFKNVAISWETYQCQMSCHDCGRCCWRPRDARMSIENDIATGYRRGTYSPVISV